MTNKKLGNDFEQEVCERLYKYGFWVHNFQQKHSGQPADIIAVKNKKAYLIDAKVCTDDVFDLSRVEENQDLSMGLWSDCGNGFGWFALKTSKGIYMINSYLCKVYAEHQSSLSMKEILQDGRPIRQWVKSCDEYDSNS